MAARCGPVTNGFPVHFVALAAAAVTIINAVVNWTRLKPTLWYLPVLLLCIPFVGEHDQSPVETTGDATQGLNLPMQRQAHLKCWCTCCAWNLPRGKTKQSFILKAKTWEWPVIPYLECITRGLVPREKKYKSKGREVTMAVHISDAIWGRNHCSCLVCYLMPWENWNSKTHWRTLQPLSYTSYMS